MSILMSRYSMTAIPVNSTTMNATCAADLSHPGKWNKRSIHMQIKTKIMTRPVQMSPGREIGANPAYRRTAREAIGTRNQNGDRNMTAPAMPIARMSQVASTPTFVRISFCLTLQMSRAGSGRGRCVSSCRDGCRRWLWRLVRHLLSFSAALVFWAAIPFLRRNAREGGAKTQSMPR